MKRPEYVATCVRAYRELLDAWYNGQFSDQLVQKYKAELAAVFNRGGFTEGYYNQKNGKQMMSTEYPGNAGVTIGEVRKNYILPHHQFFMAMGDKFKRKIDLLADSTEISKYLHGEEFDVNCENGWAVVTVNGCSVGGVKVVNGRAKNHYPKGLRIK